MSIPSNLQSVFVQFQVGGVFPDNVEDQIAQAVNRAAGNKIVLQVCNYASYFTWITGRVAALDATSHIEVTTGGRIQLKQGTTLLGTYTASPNHLSVYCTDDGNTYFIGSGSADPTGAESFFQDLISELPPASPNSFAATNAGAAASGTFALIDRGVQLTLQGTLHFFQDLGALFNSIVSGSKFKLTAQGQFRWVDSAGHLIMLLQPVKGASPTLWVEDVATGNIYDINTLMVQRHII